jgi:hypothetical protein
VAQIEHQPLANRLHLQSNVKLVILFRQARIQFLVHDRAGLRNVVLRRCG